MKLPLLHNTRIHTPKGTLGFLVVTPSDTCPATAPCLASTQVLRSRRVSSALKSPEAYDAHRSDRSDPQVRPTWCCSTSVFDLGFVAQSSNLVVLW
jgi:hypothetical protein